MQEEVLEASEQEGARESRGLYWRGGGSAGLVSGFELQELWLGAAWCGVVCSSWRFVEGASEGRHTGVVGGPTLVFLLVVERFCASGGFGVADRCCCSSRGFGGL